MRLVVFVQDAGADPFKIIRMSYYKLSRCGLRSKHLLQRTSLVISQQGEGEDERRGRALGEPAINIVT